MKDIRGKMRSFQNRKRLSYFILQEIPYFFPILNVQTCNCILGADILYACAKFQSEMISLKTFLKRKTMSTEFLTAQTTQLSL